MARKKSLSSLLYNAARMTRTAEVWGSGSPARIARRYKNKWIGRKAVSRIWRWP